MKLLMCDRCGDVFNLKMELKSCGCGRTKGRYVNNEEAVVNGEGISLALGNGSLQEAMYAVWSVKEDFRKSAKSVWDRHPTSLIAWVRPHEGPANPHTTVVKELK